jgi:hypothetical protein
MSLDWTLDVYGPAMLIGLPQFVGTEFGCCNYNRNFEGGAYAGSNHMDLVYEGHEDRAPDPDGYMFRRMIQDSVDGLKHHLTNNSIGSHSIGSPPSNAVVMALMFGFPERLVGNNKDPTFNRRQIDLTKLVDDERLVERLTAYHQKCMALKGGATAKSAKLPDCRYGKDNEYGLQGTHGPLSDLSKVPNSLWMCYVCCAPTKKVCPCKTGIYYCSKECQKTDWRLHKAEHRQVLADIAQAKAAAKVFAQCAQEVVNTKCDIDTNSTGITNTVASFLS